MIKVLPGDGLLLCSSVANCLHMLCCSSSTSIPGNSENGVWSCAEVASRYVLELALLLSSSESSTGESNLLRASNSSSGSSRASDGDPGGVLKFFKSCTDLEKVGMSRSIGDSSGVSTGNQYEMQGLGWIGRLDCIYHLQNKIC